MKRPARTTAAGPGPLTPVEFHVLLALSEGERHGYAILQDVSTRTDDRFRVRTGTLYTVIKRMLDDEWIEESETRRKGEDERRRYYKLTPQGRTVLTQEAQRLQSLVTLAQERRILGPRRRLATERGR